MAWQTPKTNWGAADGVRDTDFNRIEGNILELYNKQDLKDVTTIYVNDTTGNDTSGAGTAAAPYKTIMKAVNSLPKNLGGYNAAINIAAGTYNEAVKIDGFAGKLVLTGSTSASVNITKLTVSSCVCLISNIVVGTSSSGITIEVSNGGALICTAQTINATSTSTGTPAVRIVNLSSLYVANTLNVTGTGGGAALTCAQGSIAHINTLTGTGKATGIEATNGGIASYMTNSFVASGAAAVAYAGGRMYAATQTSIPNY